MQDKQEFTPQFKPGQTLKVLGAQCRVKVADGPVLTIDIIKKRLKWSGKLRDGIANIQEQAYFVRAVTDRRLYLLAVDMEKDDDGKIVKMEVAGEVG